MTYKVGEYIRAFDFKPLRGCGDCYVEGKVIHVDETTYTLNCEVDFWGGESQTGTTSRIGREIKIPKQLKINDYSYRIIKL